MVIEKRKTFYEKIKRGGLELFKKTSLLGEGGQGKVYKYCENKRNCIAVKKMYLDNKQSKYVDDPLSKGALKHSNFIEIAAMKLTNDLVLQSICPNFILNYSDEYIERDGVCDDLYPYTSYFYNEYIDNSEVYTEWVKREHATPLWYNAYFQICVGIYALQYHFDMIHLDLHSDNIIVQKVKPGGYWKYIIGKKEYIVPNLGYIFYINDFGHAWIPNKFESWFIRKRYNKKHIHKNFDVMRLFKSTLNFSTSPLLFKKKIRYIIREMKNKNFEKIIEEIWDEYLVPMKRKYKLIDIYRVKNEIQ